MEYFQGEVKVENVFLVFDKTSSYPTGHYKCMMKFFTDDDDNVMTVIVMVESFEEKKRKRIKQ
jgi:hypothetical protein